jgi:AcrR family transcriptional regulator
MQHKPVLVSGRPRAFDRDVALGQAMQLFWRQGYLGTSISDLTSGMGISRPSLYAAFGSKEALFREAMERYFAGPAAYLVEALKEPRARVVAERLLVGFVDMATDPGGGRTCMWSHSAMSCGGAADPMHGEFVKERRKGLAKVRARFVRAVEEGDLPKTADPGALALFVQTVNFGLSIQAATGATRQDLMATVGVAMLAWPSR